MSKRTMWVAAAVVILLGWGAWRWASSKDVEGEDAARAAGDAPTVAVARVERGSLNDELKIAGEFKPFQEVDVHAKVAGYIQKMYVDVGDHVKEGQTLAVLEIPELAAQVSGAEAAVRHAEEEIRGAQSRVERAQSTHSAAHSAYVRLKQASDARAGLVAQQELDDSQARDLEAEAQVASSQAELSAAKQQLEVARANLKQFNALSDYKRITAPFTGVVTQRYADTGALIQAGTTSNTQAMPVVRMAEVSKLRLVLPIPESVSGQIRLGSPVQVRVQALKLDLQGRVARFADALDPQTRTMETEIDFDNREGRLIPGMYTETTLSLQKQENALVVPLQAVSRNGEDASVLAVSPENTLEERRVKLGMEDNSRVEILSGLNEKDRVAIGSKGQLRAGQKIQPKEVASSNAMPGEAR